MKNAALNEKHEILGILVVVFGCVCIGLDWGVTWQQFAIVFVGCATFLGPAFYDGFSAGPVGVNDD